MRIECSDRKCRTSNYDQVRADIENKMLVELKCDMGSLPNFLSPEKELIAKTGDAQHHLGILVGDLPKSVP